VAFGLFHAAHLVIDVASSEILLVHLLFQQTGGETRMLPLFLGSIRAFLHEEPPEFPKNGLLKSTGY